MIQHIAGDNGTISAIVKGRAFMITQEHPKYQEIKALLEKDGVEDEFIRLADRSRVITDFSQGFVSVRGGLVYYRDEPLDNVISTRLLALMDAGLPFKPLAHFLENLMLNPSKRSVDSLYQFLKNRRLPLTADGMFLGLKRVKDDWHDFHTGKIDNSIGEVVEMDRNKVSDDPQSVCHQGLHVGSYDYVQGFNTGKGHIIIVEVNPRDVVCIAYNDPQKIRCCRYRVLDAFLEEKNDLEALVYQTHGPQQQPTALVPAPSGMGGYFHQAVGNVAVLDEEEDDDDYEDDDYDYDYEDEDDYEEDDYEDEDEEADF